MSPMRTCPVVTSLWCNRMASFRASSSTLIARGVNHWNPSSVFDSDRVAATAFQMDLSHFTPTKSTAMSPVLKLPGEIFRG